MKEVEPGMMRPKVTHANFFDVARGTVWGPRTIVDPELVLVVSGALLYERDDESDVAVRQGGLLFIEPALNHTLRECGGGGRTVISCIHFEPLSEMFYRDGGYHLTPEPPTVTDTDGSYVIRDLFLRCASALGGYSCYRDLLAGCIFHELWVRLAERWAGGGEATSSSRMIKMLSFIKRNLNSKIGRNQLAEQFGLTPQYVNALFKREMGVTPTEFIHRERINLAHRLMMEEGLSVKEAAARVGFSDQFHFSRIFKRIMKFSPSRSV